MLAVIKCLLSYHYLLMNIYSRKIVGWQIHNVEGRARAADLMIDIRQRENIKRGRVILRSGSGRSMKSAIRLAPLQSFAVMPSFSRSSVSDLNLYCESLICTINPRFTYPGKPFRALQAKCTNLFSGTTYVSPNHYRVRDTSATSCR